MYDTILIIIIILSAEKLKGTFSSSKHHRYLWLDFFFLDVFSPENVSLVKQKADLDAEVTMKLLRAVRFVPETNRLQVISTML